MATLNSTSTYQNNNGLNMANVHYFTGDSRWSWLSPTNIHISGTATQDYYGSFTYDNNGNVYGTIISSYYSGSYFSNYADYSITNASVDANTAFGFINTRQIDQLFSLVFSGDDQINGTAKGDNLIGFNGNDIISGNAGNDILNGGAGNDTLTGGGGNDMIDGGAGIDISTYTNNRSNFTVTPSGSGFIVTDNTGANGVDTMNNIERLSFTDGTLALDISGTSGQMYRLYKAAFNRVPDAPGLGWNIGLVDDGLAIAQMSAAFVASAEFTNTYGALSNTQFIDQLYLNVLGRVADPVGAAWNLNLLDTNAVDRPGMLGAYSESAENQLAVIGQIQDGIWFT